MKSSTQPPKIWRVCSCMSHTVGFVCEVWRVTTLIMGDSWHPELSLSHTCHILSSSLPRSPQEILNMRIRSFKQVFFYGFSFQSSLSETHEKGVPILKRKKKLYFQQFYGYSKPRNLMFMILMFRISWEWLSESNETCPGVTWHTQVLTRFSQWSHYRI